MSCSSRALTLYLLNRMKNLSASLRQVVRIGACARFHTSLFLDIWKQTRFLPWLLARSASSFVRSPSFNVLKDTSYASSVRERWRTNNRRTKPLSNVPRVVAPAIGRAIFHWSRWRRGSSQNTRILVPMTVVLPSLTGRTPNTWSPADSKASRVFMPPATSAFRGRRWLNTLLRHIGTLDRSTV